jgi:DNA-binding response OmpR family regulator
VARISKSKLLAQGARTNRTRAAKAAVDPDRLIEGEDAKTTHAGDARRWITIYGELVAFKEELIARTEQAVTRMSVEAGAEVAKTDLPVMLAELQRLRKRLDLWHERHWEIGGLDLDERQHTISHRGKTISLTRRETELMSFFLAHPDRFFNPQALLDRAWHDPHLSPDQVRSYVLRLRKRLADLALPCQLLSRAGKGYSLVFK